MARPEFAEIPAYEVERYRDLLGEDYAEVAAAAERARGVFAGRTVWNVNSTLHGGGVAEMLRALLPYVRGAGVDSQWVVLQGAARVLRVDQAPAQQPARRLGRRRRSGRARARALRERAHRQQPPPRPAAEGGRRRPLPRPSDGGPDPGGEGDRGHGSSGAVTSAPTIPTSRPVGPRDFLAPYVTAADAYVFSRRSYVWDMLGP